MLHQASVRLYTWAAALLLIAVPASAQYTPRTLDDPATGEKYHIEGSVGIWMPSADMSIASEQLGIIGTVVNLKNDLGLTDHNFSELHVVLRPARKHKLRFQYIPMDYQQGPISISRDLVFQGQRYRVGLPVNSSLEWKAYRFGYEYDFLTKNRWFAGLLLDMKYTDVSATLDSPLANEFVRARGPVPAIGGIFRGYVVPNISITGELSAIDIPDSLGRKFDVDGHYFDLDIYGTVNFTNNVGAQLGYRSFDVGYRLEDDTGSFKLRGLYFGVVARY